MLRIAPAFLGAAALALLAQTPAAAPEPWKDSDLVHPADLAARFAANAAMPSVLYVGFPVLYRSAHIRGADLAGPASKPDGVERLKQMAANLPRDRELIVYCGCCPWDHCPNVRPAFRLLREMGFTHLKLLTIPTNLSTDWIAKGYPTERPPS